MQRTNCAPAETQPRSPAGDVSTSIQLASSLRASSKTVELKRNAPMGGAKFVPGPARRLSGLARMMQEGALVGVGDAATGVRAAEGGARVLVVASESVSVNGPRSLRRCPATKSS